MKVGSNLGKLWLGLRVLVVVLVLVLVSLRY